MQFPTFLQNMAPYLILVQGIGFVACFISLISYQFKNQQTLFALKVTGDVLWTLHYALLQAYIPAFTIAVAAVRTYLVVFVCPRYKGAIISIAILTVIFFSLYLNEESTRSILPALTAIIYGLSVYYYQSYVISRLLMALGLCIWIVIGVLYGSYAEVISSTFGLCSLALGFYRHKFHQ